ncbi:basic proline-rich protein-like [Harpia harpyja]|uniref:basic proline-rich protein-like n=1 Tax=Harpia harpyja TaxID=202280 RepID=UPI0022B1642B|nr:basic proline-rich protein-like [Harpia harpyja]
MHDCGDAATRLDDAILPALERSRESKFTLASGSQPRREVPAWRGRGGGWVGCPAGSAASAAGGRHGSPRGQKKQAALAKLPTGPRRRCDDTDLRHHQAGSTLGGLGLPCSHAAAPGPLLPVLPPGHNPPLQSPPPPPPAPRTTEGPGNGLAEAGGQPGGWGGAEADCGAAECGAATPPPRPARPCPAASAGQPAGGGAGGGPGLGQGWCGAVAGGHRPLPGKASPGHHPPRDEHSPAADGPPCYGRPAIVPRRKRHRSLRAAHPRGSSGSPAPPPAAAPGKGVRAGFVGSRRRRAGGAASGWPRASLRPRRPARPVRCGSPGRLPVARVVRHGQPCQRKTHERAWKALPGGGEEAAVGVPWSPPPGERCIARTAVVFLERQRISLLRHCPA